jgi:predicted amidohydrolase
MIRLLGTIVLGRRELLRAGTVIASATMLSKVMAGSEATSMTASMFKAAVLRVPVLVPPSIEQLQAVRQRNAEAMVAAIDGVMAGASKPRLLVFPVLQYTSSQRSVSGIPMSAVAVDLISEPLQNGIYAPVVEACRRHDCYVVTTTQEKTPQMPGIFFHTGFIMGPEGLVLRSPKAQVYSAPDVTSLRDIAPEYVRLFGAASILPVVQTPIGRLGCFVEAEAEVMEAARLLVSKGAEIIVHPSAEREEVPWLAIKQATAYECHVYLLTANSSRNVFAGDPAGQWGSGSSTIVGPDGRVMATLGGREEGAATADLDLAAVAEARRKFGPVTSPAGVLYKGLY